MYKLVLCLLLIPTLAFSQDYKVGQATFLKADAAQVFDAEVGVSIQVEGLKPDIEYKAVLTLQDQTITKLTIWKLIEINGQTVAVFPPTSTTAVAPGVFHITGSPGDSFGTDISDQWIKISIGPTPAPPPPPPQGGPTTDDIQGLAKVVQKSSSLNDPITAKYIKTALESLSEVSEPTAIKEAIGKALIDSMKEVRPPYKDWEGVFRKPVDAYLTGMKDRLTAPEHMKIMIKVIADNLGVGTQSIPSKVIMYTNSICPLCTKWKQEVYPNLQKKGWILEERNSDGFVPRYIICDNNKCSEEITGYLSTEDFVKVINRLRGNNAIN